MPNLSQYRQTPPLLAIGHVIRTARLERNMSQEELAHAAALDVSYVGRIERGDNNVSMLALLKLATALGCTLAELMTQAQL